MKKLESTQKIVPFLWFNDEAEEAANFYTGIFPDSKVTNVSRYGKGAPAPEGTVMSVSFVLNGLNFSALNGGPAFDFTPAISFFIHCEDQKEIDFYWTKLTEGGKESQCGWLTDRYGLSWQVVPSQLGSLLSGKNNGNSKKVMEAMLKMQKLDLEILEAASLS